MFNALRLGRSRFLQCARPSVRSVRSSLNASPSILQFRQYSSRKSENQLPKLRYFFLIFALGTAGFLASLNLVGENRNKHEVKESDLKNEKSDLKKRAFKDNEAFVVFVLGGPGSGKGTQCARIVNDYKFAHLSAGDLLRAEQQRPGSKYGDLIRNHIKSGQIVPQEITIELLKSAMRAEMEKGISHFLIDGFPRKMDQALTFEEDVVPCKFVLFFQCPQNVMLERLISRGQTSGRDDDNIESIKKRFKVFVDQSMPVVEYFDSADKVAKLQCDEPVDSVYADVCKALAKHGVNKTN